MEKPEDALGRVVVFGYTVTARRGRKSTAAEIYGQDFKKEISNHRLYMRRKKDTQEKKIKVVPFREVPAVLSFTQLSKELQDHYRERTKQEIDYKYYRVHSVDKVTTASDAPSSLSAETASSNTYTQAQVRSFFLLK